MNIVPLPFSIFLFLLTVTGLSGNLRFIYCNYKQSNLHKQLLVLVTVIQTIGCILEMCDLIRIFFGIPLTRVSCLQFIGGPFAAVNFGNAILCFLLGFEIIILISNPNLYKKMKIWWFHATLYATFTLSGWWIYKSWTPEEDVNVLMCIPPTALTKEVNAIRSKWILINNFLILFQYLVILVMLLVKRNGQRSSYTNKIIMSSLILMVVFTFSWFSASLLVVFAAPISKMMNIPASYVLFPILVTGMLTFSQTHYVYFFVGAENRKDFWKRGPIALFVTSSKSADNVISVSVARTDSRIQ